MPGVREMWGRARAAGADSLLTGCVWTVGGGDGFPESSRNGILLYG